MKTRLLGFLALTASLCSTPVAAAPNSLKAETSFRIGTGGVLCTAQARLADPALKTMFDRGYEVVCRDAAAPVGRLYALRLGREAIDGAVSRVTAGLVGCGAVSRVMIAEVGTVKQIVCGEAGLGTNVYAFQNEGTVFLARGLAGYDSALRLGLTTLISDRIVQGDVEVTATGAGDAATFARVQAGTLDPDQVLAQGYLRNNAGSYAEAASFFAILTERSNNAASLGRAGEYYANQALQQSNLGNYPEADALFARATATIDRTDPVQVRLLRNFRAIHQLNRNRPAAALDALGADIGSATGQIGLERTRVAEGWIDRPIAQRLNTEDEKIAQLGGVDGRLTPEEKLAILGGQAMYLRGAALRASGKAAEARPLLVEAGQRLSAVRGGRVVSTLFIRASALTELSAIAESTGDQAQARAQLEEAVRLYQAEYPASAALLSARARLAALLVRQGLSEEAASLYKDVIAAGPRTPGAFQALRGLIVPYFDLLISRSGADPTAAADLFAASQIMTRPGVAQTQAVLARELSGGTDEAAALFRQSTTLTRDIVRTETVIGRLTALEKRNAEDDRALSDARGRLDELSREQTALLAKLAEFPRYRVVSTDILPLADLQAKLRPAEAYYKLVLIERKAYGILATNNGARVLKVDATLSELEQMVATLRDTIVRFEDGQAVTLPFEAKTARALYLALFNSVDTDLAQVRHLIFEPDGPLLQLPVNLLITEQAGLDKYLARAAKPGSDKYDMTGIAWLGRSRLVSTAVSPKAFTDVRSFAPSRAKRTFLGLGENATALLQPASGKSLSGERDCDWPLATWNAPISSEELRIAATALGKGNPEVLTGGSFTDTALRERGDLAQFRVLHFATHGLVTAPKPECPARPALLTSFGPDNSDGLLTFSEIFDLRLDADTVILSACDTAGAATVAATREAGIATGGNFALDGLVRAFVGAGARAVVASHWPVPDDYDATKTLITGLYSNPEGTSLGEALRESQLRLMDAAVTSHPYYWSGFAIVGDAAKPLLGAGQSAPSS